ncbi:queuosine precursor transporter [Candidatus Babeliales bacterium]|nr:queuosine precursor transporter [Candidatus Babeliales bacterium]
MNEILFLAHIIFITASTLGALKLGKEALMSCIALQAVLANFFVLKQITLVGFNATCSDVFIIGSVLGLNLLNEYFGPREAKLAVWISFAAMIFFGFMSQMHLFYIPSSFDSAHGHFLKLLTPAPRILVASFAAYFISTRFDVWFYSFLKKMISEKLVLRTTLSIMTTQLLDTILFSFLGLYGVLNSILSIMFVSYLIKLSIIFISAPLSSFSKKIVKNEKV